MDDLQVTLASADPAFEPCQTSMWQEFSPAQEQDKQNDVAMGLVDQKIIEIDANTSKAQWESDTLKLAKDTSMAAKLLQKVSSNERTDRLAKVTAIKEQNQIGAQVVSQFSAKNCVHVTLATPDAEHKLSQAGLGIKSNCMVWFKACSMLWAVQVWLFKYVFAPCQFLTEICSSNGGVVVWVDMMKLGRVQSKQLDDVASRLKKILSRKPSHTMGFVVAPYLTSSRTLNGSLRGEIRNGMFQKGLVEMFIFWQAPSNDMRWCM